MHKSLAVALSLWACVGNAETARLDSTLTWRMETEQFGGLSGLEVSDDGATFTGVSDFGIAYRGAFQRGKNGQIIGLTEIETWNIAQENGAQPQQKKHRDTEALATHTTGDSYLSLEGDHRILQYADLAAPPIAVIGLEGFGLGENAGIEALAVSPHGEIVAIPERSSSVRTPFPIRKWHDGEWETIASLPRHGGFRPVGADFDATGQLFVLSRAFNGLAFATRVDRVTWNAKDEPNTIRVFQSNFGDLDNLEGVSVWRDHAGKTRLTLVSDDNRSFLQVTQFVELIL